MQIREPKRKVYGVNGDDDVTHELIATVDVDYVVDIKSIYLHDITIDFDWVTQRNGLVNVVALSILAVMITKSIRVNTVG